MRERLEALDGMRELVERLVRQRAMRGIGLLSAAPIVEASGIPGGQPPTRCCAVALIVLFAILIVTMRRQGIAPQH